ncbi:MAG TPA: hypothetical protein VFS34_13565 [Thermoanaerobaculia bacterium]|nr:hypothetical protein [Thermoanaerobaculia bacterium]
MLQEFITQNRTELIAACRAKVAARSLPVPTPEELESGVPLFLDQLADILRGGWIRARRSGRARRAAAMTCFAWGSP